MSISIKRTSSVRQKRLINFQRKLNLQWIPLKTHQQYRWNHPKIIRKKTFTRHFLEHKRIPLFLRRWWCNSKKKNLLGTLTISFIRLALEDLEVFGRSRTSRHRKYMQWKTCLKLSKFNFNFRVIMKKSVHSVIN